MDASASSSLGMVPSVSAHLEDREAITAAVPCTDSSANVEEVQSETQGDAISSSVARLIAACHGQILFVVSNRRSSERAVGCPIHCQSIGSGGPFNPSAETLLFNNPVASFSGLFNIRLQ